MTDLAPQASPGPYPPLAELVQPFLGLWPAPRALWAVYLLSFLEGFVYFGMLIYLAMYFNGTAGSATCTPAGWWAPSPRASPSACCSSAAAPTAGACAGPSCVVPAAHVPGAHGPGPGARAWAWPRGGLLTPFIAVALGGILLIVLGYGMFTPAGYAAVRQFTTPASASMGFAMLYAVMNLGGWLPTFMSPIRQRWGIQRRLRLLRGHHPVAFLACLASSCSSRNAGGRRLRRRRGPRPDGPARRPRPPAGSLAGLGHWLRNHPLADPKFACFIFCLVPVQTLFAYNWLVLPQYVNRAFAGTWVGARFEAATSLNSLLIFMLCPVVAALTARTKVYPMMILGTALMGAPTFFLALGPTVRGLLAFIILMTVGEAIWQPRFLQYAAEIAPEGRTGAYMGVAQFPWFLTKMVVPVYSGAALARWCPDPSRGVLNTTPMWLIFGGVAMLTSVLLVLAKGWLGKDLKRASAS